MEDDLTVAEDTVHIPMRRCGTEVHDLHVTLRWLLLELLGLLHGYSRSLSRFRAPALTRRNAALRGNAVVLPAYRASGPGLSRGSRGGTRA